MEGLVICHRGVERTVEKEIRELLKKKPTVHETALSFSVKDEKELAKLCYRSQSALRVLLLLGTARAYPEQEKTLKSIDGSIAKMELSGWLQKRTFKAECRRVGEHEYSGPDIAAGAGESIIRKTKAKVSLDEPDVVVYIYIHGKDCYIGLDLSGFDLSKRDYKVFIHPDSLNSTVAYALFRESGFAKGTMLDPFCGAGTIPIEAALYLNRISPHFYRKDRFAMHRWLDCSLEEFDERQKSGTGIIASDHILKSVRSTKSNAKLAGVEKSIKTTRMDIEWLDTKLDEGSVGIIITNPPSESKAHDRKQVQKLYREFFHQAEYILGSGGKIAACLYRDEAFLSEAGSFRIEKEFSIWQGKQELRCLLLTKAKQTL